MTPAGHVRRTMPPEIAAVWVPFDWDNAKLWALDLPAAPLPVTEVAWMLDLPCWRRGAEWFVVRPREVLDHPDLHPEHRDRIERADLRWPIDITRNRDRWHVLDGLHRLARIVRAGGAVVQARVLPPELVPDVLRIG